MAKYIKVSTTNYRIEVRYPTKEGAPEKVVLYKKGDDTVAILSPEEAAQFREEHEKIGRYALSEEKYLERLDWLCDTFFKR